jgi:Uma2 family endonuclease
MAMASSFETRLGNTIIRHVRAVRPLDFRSSEPEDEKLGETTRHLELRTFLYQLLKSAFAPANSVGSEQFVYWNARDPRRTCAPDAFVKLGVANAAPDTWKTWLRGAPELVVEILSKHDREPLTWEEKLERFHELGVSEVLRFDVEGKAGRRLRAWDRVEDDLVERAVSGDTTPCVTLGLHWVVAPAPELAAALRLARDPEGRELMLAPIEVALAREADALARAEAAQARVAELEAELRVALSAGAQKGRST